MTPQAGWAAARPGQRRLLLHAGLHKTGTTALQHFLHRETAALLARGVLYPLAGRIHGSVDHHCIAWQMIGDRRYRREQGTLDALATEIAAFAGDAIVSSEGFTTLLGQPGGLLPLLTHPALADHTATVLLYLRDQASFAESLYFEMLKHGMAEEAGRMADSVITLGQVRFREWTFHFDYLSLYRRLAAEPGLTVALRPYASLVGGSTVTDFLDFAGLLSGWPQRPESHANMRNSLGESAEMFCRHRLGWKAAPPVIRPAALLLPGGRSMTVTRTGPPPAPRAGSPEGEAMLSGANTLGGGRKVAFSAAVRAAMQARFAADNAALAAEAGLPPDTLAIAPEPPPGSLALERLFSRDLQAAALDGRPETLTALFAAATGPTEPGFA